MNGRVYDPVIGRFLSADPFVQFPESTQGFNRYTYVGNNPLSYSDPSGYFSLKKALKSVAQAAVGIWLAGPMLGGALVGYLNGGGLDGAILGFAGGAFAYGINSSFAALSKGALGGAVGQALTQAALHGITQGSLTMMGGGRFGDGFLGGVAGSLAASTGLANTGNPTADIVIGAVLGGTVADIGGGEFANGAISGAMAAAFGNMRSDGTVSGSVSGGSGSGKVQELQVTFDTSQGYATEAEAAQAALETANRVSDYSNGSNGDFEVVGFVGKAADGLYYPSVGWVTDSTFRFQPVFVDSAVKPVAIYHTHPNHGPNPLSFSKVDIRFAEQTKANSYLGPPNGDFRVYRPGTMNPLSDGTHTGISLCPGGSPGCLPTHSGWR